MTDFLNAQPWIQPQSKPQFELGDLTETLFRSQQLALQQQQQKQQAIQGIVDTFTTIAKLNLVKSEIDMQHLVASAGIEETTRSHQAEEQQKQQDLMLKLFELQPNVALKQSETLKNQALTTKYGNAFDIPINSMTGEPLNPEQKDSMGLPGVRLTKIDVGGKMASRPSMLQIGQAKQSYQQLIDIKSRLLDSMETVARYADGFLAGHLTNMQSAFKKQPEYKSAYDSMMADLPPFALIAKALPGNRGNVLTIQMEKGRFFDATASPLEAKIKIGQVKNMLDQTDMEYKLKLNAMGIDPSTFHPVAPDKNEDGLSDKAQKLKRIYGKRIYGR